MKGHKNVPHIFSFNRSSLGLNLSFSCSFYCSICHMCIINLLLLCPRQHTPSKIWFLFFQLTPWEALKAELLFAINISIVTKPVHNRLTESESPKSTRSQKSRSRAASETRSSLKDKSDRSVNLNQDSNGFAPRSLSGGFNRIGNFFKKKNSG